MIPFGTVCLGITCTKIKNSHRSPGCLYTPKAKAKLTIRSLLIKKLGIHIAAIHKTLETHLACSAINFYDAVLDSIKDESEAHAMIDASWIAYLARKLNTIWLQDPNGNVELVLTIIQCFSTILQKNGVHAVAPLQTESFMVVLTDIYYHVYKPELKATIAQESNVKLLLTQLVTNLMHECLLVQDAVREQLIIVHILNSCKMDDKNMCMSSIEC